MLIEFKPPVGQRSGLLNDSAVACENLFTVRQDVVSRKIGELPDDFMRRIDECLKASLGLS